MLRVFKASGEEALSIPYDEFVQMIVLGEQPVTALALKRHLQGFFGQPRFRQRLLLSNGEILSDNSELEAPMDMQLILQPFIASSAEQIAELQGAASENDIDTMEQLLQRPQDPDLGSGGSPPALHFASLFGRSEAARLLLEANAHTDKSDNEGRTPMYISSGRGHLEVVRLPVEAEAVKLLLEANADKNKADNDGATPIYIASECSENWKSLGCY